MIDVENLVFDYPSGRALHGVSFVAPAGAVLALVGANGAGKSTLMRCIAALDEPTDGRITVVGLDTRDAPRGVHGAIGYLPDTYGLYDALTVRQALTYAARSRGVGPFEAADAVSRAAAQVGLDDRLETRAGALSRGLRQRLGIAQAVVHAPRVLLLDEPAAGLDPDARAQLSALIRELAAGGMTLMVSSHLLGELEAYCTHLLMLEQGRIAGDGLVRLADRAETLAGEPARIRVTFSDPVEGLAARLAALGLAVEQAHGQAAVLRIAPGAGTEQAALASLVSAGLPVRSFTPLRQTLEEVYMAARRPDAHHDAHSGGGDDPWRSARTEAPAP